MKIQDALDLHLKEEASRIIGEHDGQENNGLKRHAVRLHQTVAFREGPHVAF